MKCRGMLPFRRSIWLSVAVWSAASSAADIFYQSYCSTENTGSDYTPVYNIWQSNGACHDTCLADNYAFAIVQWQNCWCSNYTPGDQASVESDCNHSCPGFPDELCGNQDTGHFGYIALNAQPSGTAGGGAAVISSSSAPSASASSSEDPETSYVSTTIVQTVTQTPSQSVITSIVTPTASPTSDTTPIQKPFSPTSMPIATSTSTSTSTQPRFTPVTSVVVQTVSGNVVTQTVTSTPMIAPNSRPDNIQIQRQSGLSAGTVAGIVVGVVGGLIILALAAFLLWRRRRNHGSENGDGSVDGSKKIMTRNVSVLSKAGLLARGHRPSMSERDHDDAYYITPATGSNSVRHSMMFGGGDGVSPVSPLDSSHSGSSRRPSKPMVYDQRLNPSALFANQEANGSRISMQDQQDYSRPLGVMNPDPRPSFESRL